MRDEIGDDQTMRRTIAIFTSVPLVAVLGCGPKAAETTTPDDIEVLDRQHHSEHGFDADVLVAKSGDGLVTSRVVVEDPAATDRVEVWTDGRTVQWHGTVGGEPVDGSSPATDIVKPGEPPTPTCLHPVAAIICVGVGLASPPGGGGGTPGGGDGESDESSDDSGDGDG